MAVEMTFGFQESGDQPHSDHGQSIGPELKNPLATAREPPANRLTPRKDGAILNAVRRSAAVICA
jgi:hypothetical protein